MKIQLSDRFTYGKLIKFTLPSIAMMIFTSIYSVVDGFFVSNCAGKTQFSAVNLIMPFLMILGAIGAMLGTGGSALIAKTLGEGKKEKANSLFSLLIYTSIISGVVISVLAMIFLEDVAHLLGGEGELLEYAVIYGRINLIALPLWMLQYAFQSLFVTAEKPQIGLFVTVGSGVTNMVLDAILVGVFRMGVVGAAIATAASQAVGGLFPLFYFSRENSSLLRLGRAKMDIHALIKTCTNGSSEFLSNITMSLVGMLYNLQLIAYAGEDGLSSYGVMMYVGFFFIAVFIGYSVGSAPIIGYHYGAGNRDELKKLRKMSLTLMLSASAVMCLLSILLSAPMSKIFVGYDEALYEMTRHGFVIYSFCFLFAGLPIFSSAFFTALNDGFTSALISFLRTVIFQTAAILLLPLIWGLDGIWISAVAADVAAATVATVLLLIKRKKYGY